jgi:ABC-type branched-subunit amino acid transport system substrate-binding protein
VLNSGADVLILNHYGKDMINSLTQAVQFGLRDKQVNGERIRGRRAALLRIDGAGTGEAIKGIFGTANWIGDSLTPPRKTSSSPLLRSTRCPQSQAATLSVQTLLYANAVEMAGTFNPKSSRPWKASSSTAWATGQPSTRAKDHQCMKDILVVRGKQKPSNKYDLMDIMQVVSA